jgi:hypothetical protein
MAWMRARETRKRGGGISAEKLTRYQQLSLAEGATGPLLLGLGDAPSIDNSRPTWC